MKQPELERLEELKYYEKELWKRNYELVCGIDEAGRGPLAGPVVVGAVIMPKDSYIEGINDSKKVSPKKRLKLYEEIINSATAYSVVAIDHLKIDEINILQATKLAAKQAIENLKLTPNFIITDALKGLDTKIPQRDIVKGDAKSYAIACASILAKVTRDKMMEEVDKEYPLYGFAKHKGYGTAYHIAQIKEHGICSYHRKTFVKNFTTN